MAVLGHDRLKSLLRSEDYNDRLIVTPLLLESQVGEASIDIRLGNDFIVTRRGNLGSVDPSSQSQSGRRAIH